MARHGRPDGVDLVLVVDGASTLVTRVVLIVDEITATKRPHHRERIDGAKSGCNNRGATAATVAAMNDFRGAVAYPHQRARALERRLASS